MRQSSTWRIFRLVRVSELRVLYNQKHVGWAYADVHAELHMNRHVRALVY